MRPTLLLIVAGVALLPADVRGQGRDCGGSCAEIFAAVIQWVAEDQGIVPGDIVVDTTLSGYEWRPQLNRAPLPPRPVPLAAIEEARVRSGFAVSHEGSWQCELVGDMHHCSIQNGTFYIRGLLAPHMSGNRATIQFMRIRAAPFRQGDGWHGEVWLIELEKTGPRWRAVSGSIIGRS